MFKRTLLFVFMLIRAAIAHADDGTPPGNTPLDDLLSTPISTAAKYDQRINEVPASVTVISSEEINRYGWHTLADVLSAVRGVYTTYDRGYTYLGVRGIGLPTDYNNRFLVLIDGHPMLETVSGSSGIGTTLALDLSLFSRIEFVRGPSSVMYGTGAMFGVINLITKNEDERSAASVAAGNRGTKFGSSRMGFHHGRLAASVGISWQENGGGDVYFHEFDTPESNHGVVHDRDFDNYRSILATFNYGELSAVGLHTTRTKAVPTASWGTTFGANEQTTDGRTFLGLRFCHHLTPISQIMVRSYVDRFRYYGDYPYGNSVWSDESVSTHQRAEVQYVCDLRPNHRARHRRSRVCARDKLRTCK